MFSATGASPVSISFSEVFGALNKGNVDAEDASANVNNAAAGLQALAPYPLYPGIHSLLSMQFTVNTKTNESLSEEAQAALSTWWNDAMYAMAAETDRVDKELGAKGNATDDIEVIEVIDWVREDLDELRVVAHEQWEEYAKNHRSRKKLWMHISPI